VAGAGADRSIEGPGLVPAEGAGVVPPIEGALP
jgi:hypothetical protein